MAGGWLRAAALLVVLPSSCSGWQQAQGRSGALRAAELPSPFVHVSADMEPVELNFTAGGLVFSDDFPTNPKNGTPWFRTKHKNSRGESSHPHFQGLVAQGDFATDSLAAHNAVRSRVGLGSLAWNDHLAALAAKRVDKLANEGCYIRHSPTYDRWEEAGFRYIGENLYKVINMRPTGVDIVDAWYAEIDDYTYGPVGSACVKGICQSRSSPPCVLGHFTQVMWEETTDVGCARAQCPHEAQETFVAVCWYGPGGNIVGQVPFTPRGSEQLGFSSQACDIPTREVQAPLTRVEPVVHRSAAARWPAGRLAALVVAAAAFAGI
jgi:pathogenesis-related protein 1